MVFESCARASSMLGFFVHVRCIDLLFRFGARCSNLPQKWKSSAHMNSLRRPNCRARNSDRREALKMWGWKWRNGFCQIRQAQLHEIYYRCCSASLATWASLVCILSCRLCALFFAGICELQRRREVRRYVFHFILIPPPLWFQTGLKLKNEEKRKEERYPCEFRTRCLKIPVEIYLEH